MDVIRNNCDRKNSFALNKFLLMQKKKKIALDTGAVFASYAEFKETLKTPLVSIVHWNIINW